MTQEEMILQDPRFLKGLKIEVLTRTTCGVRPGIYTTHGPTYPGSPFYHWLKDNGDWIIRPLELWTKAMPVNLEEWFPKIGDIIHLCCQGLVKDEDWTVTTVPHLNPSGRYTDLEFTGGNPERLFNVNPKFSFDQLGWVLQPQSKINSVGVTEVKTRTTRIPENRNSLTCKICKGPTAALFSSFFCPKCEG